MDYLGRGTKYETAVLANGMDSFGRSGNEIALTWSLIQQPTQYSSNIPFRQRNVQLRNR